MKEAVLANIRARRALGVKHARRRMPRQQQPDMLRLDYARALVGIVSSVRDIVEAETGGLSILYVRNDAENINDALDRAARRVADRLRPSELQEVAAQIGKKTSAFQKEQLTRQAVAAIGVDISHLFPGVDTVLEAFVSDNVSLIKSVPGTYLGEVEKTLTSSLRAGERWETTAEKLAERFGVAESKARLIARDQVGKLYGQLNEVRQKNLGVTSYIWQTSQDGRVRDEHEERQGESFEWGKPPDDGHPGEPVNCRCYAEPDFSAIFESLR